MCDARTLPLIRRQSTVNAPQRVKTYIHALWELQERPGILPPRIKPAIQVETSPREPIGDYMFDNHDLGQQNSTESLYEEIIRLSKLANIRNKTRWCKILGHSCDGVEWDETFHSPMLRLVQTEHFPS